MTGEHLNFKLIEVVFSYYLLRILPPSQIEFEVPLADSGVQMDEHPIHNHQSVLAHHVLCTTSTFIHQDDYMRSMCVNVVISYDFNLQIFLFTVNRIFNHKIK